MKGRSPRVRACALSGAGIKVLIHSNCRIEAEVQKGTREDALWFALGANKTNGQRMTPSDVRHAVKIALETWPDKSQTEIAEQVGTSQATVHRVKDVIQMNNVPLPATRTDSIGRVQPTTYTRREPEEQIADTPWRSP